MSPAQVIFGCNLRDHLPGIYGKYQPRREWRLKAEQRAQALAKRHGQMDDRLHYSACALPPLSLGNTVLIQDQQANYNNAGRSSLVWRWKCFLAAPTSSKCTAAST